MPGGGGLGDPAARDRAQLAIDVRDGFVSVEQAKAVYGWDAATATAGDD